MENELFMNAGVSNPPVMTSQSPSAAMLNWVSTQQLDPSQSRNLSRDSFFCEKSTEQSIFNSALSSPSNSNYPGEENFMISKLIRKLGNINEIYGTPTTTNLAEFPGDPGFAERAAKFSCFGKRSFNGLTNSPLIDNGQIPTNEEPPRVYNIPALKPIVSQIPAGETSGENSRKRKTKSNQHSPSKEEDFDTKRNKKTEENEDKTKSDDPYKDYIHVRARRGQATDSHSLAERVRREKISERMKMLQDLVPGCNKVTGKALMLDEIINYVQSLQRQVEFLSMKLSSVNTRLDYNMDTFMSKDVFTSSNNLMQHQVLHQLDSKAETLLSDHQYKTLLLNPEVSSNNIINHLETSESRSFIPHLPNISQYPTFSEDDLHSIIRMGFAQNQGSSSQVPSSHMKAEL